MLTLALLLACDEPVAVSPAPASPDAGVRAASADASPPAPPGFDCAGWMEATHLGGLGAATASRGMCSESPRLPGLWLVQGPNAGKTLTVAVVDGKPVRGGGGSVATFFRSSEIWTRPVNAEDVGGVLSAVGAFPPGFASGTSATFTPPFTYVLVAPLADWLGHGGPNSVAGALPAGPQVRATLTTAADAPTQWVIESGSGKEWAPTATIKWDNGPPEGPLR